ncbi:hypothetical protein C369_05840 [Cryptococcus neoformans A5-35-17]|nr:hypothetical protein C369_05840 [Cryptococcus neoformans var. grubii A5-35-17]
MQSGKPKGATSLKESKPSQPSLAGNFESDLPRASSSAESSRCLILILFASSHSIVSSLSHRSTRSSERRLLCRCRRFC